MFAGFSANWSVTLETGFDYDMEHWPAERLLGHAGL